MSYPRSVFQGKATLHELCRVMGLPGKPDGVSGGEVEILRMTAQ